MTDVAAGATLLTNESMKPKDLSLVPSVQVLRALLMAGGSVTAAEGR